MLRRTLPCLLAAAALGGCALPVERPARWGADWSRADDGEEARLVLGHDGESDLRLVLSCHPRWGAVEFTAVGRPDAAAVLEIHSGKAWNRYPGAGVNGAVQVRLAAIDPVLRAFADTGELTVVFDGRRLVAPAGFAAGHDFMRLCQPPGAG